jgi:S1-C subfamily serine protease
VKVVADGWAQGAGSGFVIRGYDGAALVVTNSHVLLGATRATIEFRDGRSLSASLVGSDPAVDLAVLRLSSAAGVPPLVIADDGPLVAGERLVVVGNPAGLQAVVAAGVLSARTVLPDPTIMGQAFVPFLITDAATSAGNSGSPVLDRRGEVVGMSSAILGSAHNLTVVLPGHVMSRIGTALQHAGTYRHAYAGLDVTVATGVTSAAVVAMAFLRRPRRSR